MDSLIVRLTPLLVLLLCTVLHIDVAASGSAELSASPVESEVAVATQVVQRDNHFVGPAMEQSSTMAGTFDYSYYIVLGLGIFGLVWMRRQSQSL